MSDSQLGIEYIEKELEKSLNDHLTPEQAAVARAFQVTLDDRFAWCVAIDRLVYGQGKVTTSGGHHQARNTLWIICGKTCIKIKFCMMCL